MKRHLLCGVVALALFALNTTAVHASLITYYVTLDTSALAANNPGQGPFTVDFQLNDGSSGDGINNNTAIVRSFNLYGGSLTPGTSGATGSVSGDLSSSLKLTDNGFLDDFSQQFTPGNMLSFTLDLTTNVSSSEQLTPDEFSFAVYSNNNTQTASVLTIDITGSNPVVTSIGGSLGNGVPVPGPTVNTVPEPASLSLLFGLGLGALAVSGWRRQARTAA